MSFGIRVRDAQNRVVLDTSTETVRLIDWFDAPAGQGGSRTNERYRGATVVVVQITSTSVDNDYMHRAVLSGATINYYAGQYASSTRIMVFK